MKKRNHYVEMTFKELQDSIVVKDVLRFYKYQTMVRHTARGPVELGVYTTKPVTDIQWLRQWTWLRRFAGRYNALSMIEK